MSKHLKKKMSMWVYLKTCYCFRMNKFFFLVAESRVDRWIDYSSQWKIKKIYDLFVALQCLVKQNTHIWRGIFFLLLSFRYVSFIFWNNDYVHVITCRQRILCIEDLKQQRKWGNKAKWRNRSVEQRSRSCGASTGFTASIDPFLRWELE